MKQWDIFLYPFRVEQSHPAVVISPDERCGNPDLKEVNALICTSVRLNRGPKENEFILDESDGLDWKTAVRCDLIYFLSKAKFGERRGRVAAPRRPALARHVFFTMHLPFS